MPVVRRATENQNTTWLPIPETPLARFTIGKPSLNFSVTWNRWMVRFPLTLHPSLRAELIPPRTLPENTQQSQGVLYSCGLSMGFFDKNHVYQSTNLIDFMSACFGVEKGSAQSGQKRFRTWVEAGGGPPRPLDRDDDQAELKMIEEWLGWMEGLEVYGSVSHEPDKQNSGRVWAVFGGAMPIGSLPDVLEPDYQTLAQGKLRSMMIETQQADEEYEAFKKNGSKGTTKLPPGGPRQRTAAPAVPSLEAPPAEKFDTHGRPVGGNGGAGVDLADDDEAPF